METLSSYKEKKIRETVPEAHEKHNKNVISLFESSIEEDLQRAMREALEEDAKRRKSLDKVSSTYPEILFNNDMEANSVTADLDHRIFPNISWIEKRGVDTFQVIHEDELIATSFTRRFERVDSFVATINATHNLFFGKPVVINPEKKYKETDNLISIPSCESINNLHRGNDGKVRCDTIVTNEDEICKVVHFGEQPFKVIQRTCYLYSVIVLINLRTNEVFKYLVERKEEDYYWIDVVRIRGEFCFIDLYTDERGEACSRVVQCINGNVIRESVGFAKNPVTCRDFVVYLLGNEVNILS